MLLLFSNGVADDYMFRKDLLNRLTVRVFVNFNQILSMFTLLFLLFLGPDVGSD